MAVSLFELGVLINRSISKEEEFYFSGSYFVSRFVAITNGELSNLYDEIINQTKLPVVSGINFREDSSIMFNIGKNVHAVRLCLREACASVRRCRSYGAGT
jgi:hypothetical protein